MNNSNKFKIKFAIILLLSILILLVTKLIINQSYVDGNENVYGLVNFIWTLKRSIGSKTVDILIILGIILIGLFIINIRNFKSVKPEVRITLGILFKIAIYIIISTILTWLTIAMLGLICYKYTVINLDILADIGITKVWTSILLLYLFVISFKKINNISKIIVSLRKISSGDLESSITVNTKGETREVAENINKIMEKFRLAIEEEKVSQQSKNELITNVSHDLRTPLTSILGYLELIDKDRYRDEVELRYYIDIAYKKAQSLNYLINDLFELTRMNSVSLKFNKKNINLAELIGQIDVEFYAQLKKNNMESRLDIEEDNFIIDADGNKLVRAFENLISNAIKYGKDGKFIDIKLYKEENNSITEIVNYGDVIPSYELPYIFDRFYRVEKSRSSETGGSGLGLAIAKSIIEKHDGNIVAESNSNNTKFRIIIPMINV